MGNNNKMTEHYVQRIWVKNVVILGLFPFWHVFVFRVLFFCSEHFLTVLGLGTKRSHHVLVCNFWEFSCIKT